MSLVKEFFATSNEFADLMLAMSDYLEGGEEVPAPMLQRLEELQKNQAQHIDDLAAWYRQTECQLAAREAEYKPIREQMDANVQAIKRKMVLIKGFLEMALPPSKDAVHHSDRTYLYYRTNERTEVYSQQDLPIEYTKVETAPDLAAIKKAIKSGKQVLGACLRTTYALQIQLGGEATEKRFKRKEKSVDNLLNSDDTRS